MLDVDLMRPIVIEKLKQKLKQCDMTFLPMLSYLGHKSLGRILYKNKRLSFRKVAVLEPAVLLK